jgi:hypothetical protein
MKMVGYQAVTDDFQGMNSQNLGNPVEKIPVIGVGMEKKPAFSHAVENVVILIPDYRGVSIGHCLPFLKSNSRVLF